MLAMMTTGSAVVVVVKMTVHFQSLKALGSGSEHEPTNGWLQVREKCIGQIRIGSVQLIETMIEQKYCSAQSRRKAVSVQPHRQLRSVCGHNTLLQLYFHYFLLGKGVRQQKMVKRLW